MTADAGLASWLRLTLAPGLGPAKIRALLTRYGLPEQVLAAPHRELVSVVPASALEALESNALDAAVERALAWSQQPGCAIVTLGDAAYPSRLLETSDPPSLLYIRGNPDVLRRPSLAIVGSRNATAQGARNAERFARAFSDAGLSIVSGLALGIDGAAHRGALEGRGSTAAVLGTGVDIVYPARHVDLAEAIAAHGALVSEFPLATQPAAGHFPRRNRLISGLTLGCLVVEAALESGSLITARAALEQGREVFAIPGSIHSPLSKGCHALIKSGAKLVESAEDVLSELSALLPRSVAARSTAPLASPDAPQDPLLLKLMGDDPVDVEALRARTGWPAERITAELLQLELAGRVETLAGGLFQRLR
ncbi:MAG TPA: DNA-processing protein DprA [Burkholderiales bacterium]|nr:DNA-processing protein DprA [Burkholderiales bacterium]